MALMFCGPLKVAVTPSVAVIVTEQVLFVPEQAPLQPANVLLAFGVSVRVTWLPDAKPKLHIAPQLIPGGLLVTVPVPVPASVTVNT